MAPSSRLRPRSTPASACGSTDTALPPANVISSPCIPTLSSHTDCSSVGSTSRRGRGPTKGFRSERARAKTGGKLLVQFKDNVPIGINASYFVSEIGLQVRNFAPVRGVRRWKEVPANVRQVIKARVFTKYEVVDYDTSDDVRVAVDRKFQARYRDWRSWMHTHYKNCLKKEIDSKTVPFLGVDKDDWVWVIENVYEDEKFHERSRKNTESRKRLPYNHCMGSKSFKAAMHALADPETREEPHIVEFYRESHYNKKKDKWMDEKCQEIHEKLVAEREKCTQEGAIQLTQEQISINVLGGRSGYLRGFGNGPKPTFTTRSTGTDSKDGERGALRATVERLQNENAARSQEMERLQNENVARSQEMEQMKNNQVAMQRQMEEMMRLVARVTDQT